MVALAHRYVYDSLLVLNLFYGYFPFVCTGSALLVFGKIMAAAEIALPSVLMCFTMFYLSKIISNSDSLDDDAIWSDAVEELHQSLLLRMHSKQDVSQIFHASSGSHSDAIDASGTARSIQGNGLVRLVKTVEKDKVWKRELLGGPEIDIEKDSHCDSGAYELKVESTSIVSPKFGSIRAN